MHSEKYKIKEIAIKYCIEDLSGSLVPSTLLSKTLKSLELDKKPLSIIMQKFLHSKGLLALLSYAKKEVSYTEFLKIAKPEQSERCLTNEAKALKKLAEQKLKDDAMQAKIRERQERTAAEKRAFENDPRNIAKAKAFKLRQKYDLSYFIERANYPVLMKILRQVDNGIRISEDDVVWLSTKGEEYFTEKLKKGFHLNEAKYHADQFKKNKDPWSAVNASSHYRKGREARTADSMLTKIDVSNVKKIKLKSALCTTHGGVKRDLNQWDEALSLGEKAHLFTPQDFRPCTLLGAVNMEIGQYDIGQNWYKKAIERGFSEKAMDNELQTIFFSADKSKQQKLRDHLLKVDPIRYSWTKKKHRHPKKNDMSGK